MCKNCKQKRGTPNLGITVRYDDGTEATTDKISSDDLRMLIGFFSGELVWRLDDNYKDDAIPLQKDMPRLKQLLGEPAAPPPTVPPEKK